MGRLRISWDHGQRDRSADQGGYRPGLAARPHPAAVEPVWEHDGGLCLLRGLQGFPAQILADARAARDDAQPRGHAAAPHRARALLLDGPLPRHEEAQDHRVDHLLGRRADGGSRQAAALPVALDRRRGRRDRAIVGRRLHHQPVRACASRLIARRRPLLARVQVSATPMKAREGGTDVARGSFPVGAARGSHLGAAVPPKAEC
mmetsp:Transcript_72419/g.174826  ORF Transcript_72419/g.174826 Transcript_72419/m.174826 type:complete len:204 (+) Transcript_72419:210-821(+)